MQIYPAISFPSYLLARPKPRTPDSSRLVEPVPDSFGQQLSKLLLPYVGNIVLNKAVVAEITGFSPRTLQRRLGSEGTSFSQLIDQTRHQRAFAMPAESDNRLIDIALVLGYKDAPSFTRAFRRWTGISPREYRKIQATT